MKTTSWHGKKWSTALWFLSLGAVLLLAWVWRVAPSREPSLELRLANPMNEQVGDKPIPPGGKGVVSDVLRRKYDSRVRVDLRVCSERSASIFVLATGVQVRTETGWRTEAEDQRGEIWRLKDGECREVCVERPGEGNWRAYVRYGTEMRGLRLLMAQIREAWILRSFANWTGAAWGGGRWSGCHEIFGPEIAEGRTEGARPRAWP